MTSVDRPSHFSSGQQKIMTDHLQRLACIYVRQSSPSQVLHHKESQANQYQLAQRAEALGWPAERIRVIDTDQGLSGKESSARSGFKEVVAEVSLGHVGIIFGYEVSRLARNNSDWYHLLDLAAVFNTLIADYDGIYDPRLYNDRLLLGLKGTMSEAELHLLRLRMEAGRMRQIERGEYRQHLPTGLLRLPDGTVVKEPDEQVRYTIELVFAKFQELGSCRQVMLYLRGANILLPRRSISGLHAGELLWKPATYGAVYAILTNPAYAGAFAYGRKQPDPTRRQPDRPCTGYVRKPMEEWTYLHRDVYPAFIPWEQYVRNQERLRHNATRFAESIQDPQGVVRKGAGLLQGMVVCGHCGHRLEVMYKPSPRYACRYLAQKLGQRCVSFPGSAVDEVVVQAFFEAIQPAQLDVLEAVLAEQGAERERLAQHWNQRLKRAQYEIQLAERRYNAVDPDNRLVAAELERRWEEKLQQLQSTQEDYKRFQHTSTPATLPPELREQFRRISNTLPDLWNSGQLSNEQKKELLRSLISRVILTRESPDTIAVKIVWVSDHYSITYAHPAVNRLEDLSCYDEMVKRIQNLWQQGFDDRQITDQLNAEGFRSTHSPEVYPRTVERIRKKHGWRHTWSHKHQLLESKGYLTVLGLANRLGVDRGWVYRRIRDEQIDPGYVAREHKLLVIRDDPELIEALRQQVVKK